jgi:hypothetical protein
MHTYKLNQGTHTGPDKDGVEQTWTQGTTFTTTQDLTKLGVGDDPKQFKFTEIKTGTVVVPDSDKPQETNEA